MNQLATECKSREEILRQQILSQGRAALIIAHPSHELRVHGWLEIARPQVFIWTDGSGRTGESRLDWTTKALERAGATEGSIYGRLKDRAVYDAVLNGDHLLFIGLAEELAEELVRQDIDYVVGDASEGHSVTHEVGRFMIDAALEIAGRRNRKQIRNFDFLVIGPPAECPEEVRSQAIHLNLDDISFNRKVEAALSHHPKLAADVSSALGGETLSGVMRFTERSLAETIQSSFGDMAGLREYPQLAAQIRSLFQDVKIESFRDEYLRPVDNHAALREKSDSRPFYEPYGEKLVAAGLYQKVIRHQEHIRPVADALWAHVEHVGR